MYCEDLAYIHDQGYSTGATHAATVIVQILRAQHLRRGCLLDLGCGSGHSTGVFIRAGYDVLGMDVSRAMVRLAKGRVPTGKFRVGSFPTHSQNRWDVIVAIGEIMNYLPSVAALRRRIRWAFDALHSGGIFVFDVRMPPGKGDPLKWVIGTTGKDWAVMAGSTVDPKRRTLTRNIMTLRLKGDRWRRDKEIHQQCLYRASETRRWLRVAGFHVEVRSGYRSVPLSTGKLFIARKPG